MGARAPVGESRLIHVDRTPTALDLTLRRHPASTARIALSLTTGLAAVGLGIGGGILWSRGNQAYQDHLPGLDLPVRPLPDGQPRLDAVNTLLNDNLAQFRGIGLAAGGLGAGIVAITEATGGRKRALLAEFGLGVAMATGGVIGAPLYLRNHEVWTGSTKADLDQRRGVTSLFYGLIGAGAGMAATSLIAVVTHAAIDRRLQRRSRASISLHGTSLQF